MLDLVPDFAFFSGGRRLFNGRRGGSTILALSTLRVKWGVAIEALVPSESGFDGPGGYALDDQEIGHYLASGIEGLPPNVDR